MRVLRRRRTESPPRLLGLLCAWFLRRASTAVAFRATRSTTSTMIRRTGILRAPSRLRKRTYAHDFTGGSAAVALAPGTLLAAAEDASHPQREPRERTKLRGKLPIISRTVPLGIFLEHDDDDEEEKNGGGTELSATVWEVEHPSEMMEMWWSSGATDKAKIGDPFGVVMWPGSLLASREMARRRGEIEGKTVLVLGAGTGLEAQAAAMLGARRVIATDINKLTLRLLGFGAERAGLGDIIQSEVFDLFSERKLPDCDVVIAADILYNEMLGAQMGLRCTELLGRAQAPGIIMTDSQRFAGTDFLPFVNKVMDNWGRPHLSWNEQVMESFTGSGMLIEGDQTYDVTVRMLSIGWENKS